MLDEEPAENPWPQGMSIRIEDEPRLLLEALWAREALGLDPDGDAPPLLADTPPASTADADAAALQAAWPEVWASVLAQAGGHSDPVALHAQLLATEDGSPERAALLRAALGAGWRERFGDAGFGDAYDEWSLRRFHEHARRPRAPLHETPEHLSLDALIIAWRSGLTSIVTIPCRGEYTRVISGTTLLMTKTTREHPERYSAALLSFG